MKPVPIIKDNRTIQCLTMDGSFPARQIFSLVTQIGSSVVSVIEPYYENGEMANVTWYALRDHNNTIISRINGKYVMEVRYDPPTEPLTKG